VLKFTYFILENFSFSSGKPGKVREFLNSFSVATLSLYYLIFKFC